MYRDKWQRPSRDRTFQRTQGLSVLTEHVHGKGAGQRRNMEHTAGEGIWEHMGRTDFGQPNDFGQPKEHGEGVLLSIGGSLRTWARALAPRSPLMLLKKCRVRKAVGEVANKMS